MVWKRTSLWRTGALRSPRTGPADLDPRLQRFASDHHFALVFSRRLAQMQPAPLPPMAVARLRRLFLTGLSPHMADEERLLLPHLAAVGETDLVERVRQEHRQLRYLAERFGDPRAVKEFAALLRCHVRFEERELFPACRSHLDDRILDRLVDE